LPFLVTRKGKTLNTVALSSSRTAVTLIQAAGVGNVDLVHTTTLTRYLPIQNAGLPELAP